MEFRWILQAIVIYHLQELIAGASLVNENLKPVLQKVTSKEEASSKVAANLLSFKAESKIPASTLAIPSLTPKHLHSSKTYTPKEKIITLKQRPTEHKWNFKQLKTNYKINPSVSYPLFPNDSNPFDLRTNVAGFQVKVTSVHKQLNNKDNPESFKKGHEIEIIPVETLNSKLNDKISREKANDIDNSNVISNKVSEFDVDNVLETKIQSTTDPEVLVEEKDLIPDIQKDMSSTENPLQENSLGEKSGRILQIFSRTNSSNCTTPSGEVGHCRRLSECLLSDALSNFSLFLQYLCMVRGAFVGICCPSNPVIEISDGDDAPDNSTIELMQPKEGCGRNSKTRIVGGSMTVPHEWTWMVALMRKNRFFCGGVIINNWYVLTAAHCVLGIKVKDLTVRLGEYNFQENNRHQRDLPVAEIKRHAQFVTMTFQHDIALLRLKEKVEFTNFISSICLPENDTDYTDANATVVGWGTVSFGGAVSPVLRQVTIPVWSNEECDKTYVLERITDSFMCAGSPENGEDACQGDSGGPLMSLNENGRWDVIGIVSWGRRCGDPTYPGVYTRVTTYKNWITENMQ